MEPNTYRNTKAARYVNWYFEHCALEEMRNDVLSMALWAAYLLSLWTATEGFQCRQYLRLQPRGLHIVRRPHSSPRSQVDSGTRQIKAAGLRWLFSGLLPVLALLPRPASAGDTLLTRADVGFVNLNESLPDVTSVCWLDVSVGDSAPQRIEISVFGKETPQTAANFVALARGTPGYGYRGSDIFRVIATFSVQGGNINSQVDVASSQLGKEGRSASGEPFPPENFRILHGYRDAGVVSMMKDIKSMQQDSRFFITTSPDASWADGKYVAFGLITKGMDFVRGLSVLPTTPPSNHPNTRVKIVDSGVY